MRRSPSSLLSLSRLSTLILSTLIFSAVCQAQSQPLMTRHVRDVVVNGQAPLVGLLPATRSLLFDIVLPLRDRPGLQSLIRERYDPASPSFHQFLTPQEVTARFGPSQADWDALVAFAKASGFEIIGGTRDGRDLQLSGTVANIEKAFHVTLGVYQDPTEDRTFFAIDREPTVDLPFQLWHITGLDNDSKPHPLYVKKSDYAKAHGIDPDKVVSNATTGSGPDASFLGSDMRAAYYEGTVLTGTGQNIALFEFAGTDLADLATYYNNVGQTEPYTPTLISTGGYSTSCLDSHAGGFCDDTEQTLDMTQAMGMAPGSTMLYMYVCGNAESISDTDCISAMVTDTDAPLSMQISSSWSWFPADPSTDDPYFEQMASQGQNFFVAAGDYQAWTSSCCVYPADDANIVSVGGTDLTTSSAAGPWASETAWSQSGGGISPDGIAIPSWQALAGVITPTNEGSTTLRNGPDVSANANWTFYVCADQTTCTANAYGGTSFAAPMWAGYLALANQQAVANGEEIGYINPIIYPDALTSSYSTLFHDVTSGNCGTYFAVTGYDLCTGWGSPNGSGLINALAAVLSKTSTTVASSQNPANQGVSVTLTATVTTLGSNAPTGTVTFYNANTQIGTGTLSGSGQTATATFATSTLPVGSDSITAGYGGDTNNAGSTSTALIQIINGTFTFTSDGSTHTVLAGQSTPTTSPAAYTFVATPTSAGTFAATVTFACSFAPTDPTLTNASCTFNPPSIAGGSVNGATTVSMIITTKGPNTGIGNVRSIRHRADNRSPWLPLTLPLAGIVAVGFAGRKVWKHSAVASLCVSLLLLGLLVACGGGTNTPKPILVGVQGSVSSLYPNYSDWPPQTPETFTATVTNTTNQNVTWDLSTSAAGVSCTAASNPCGSLSSTTANPTTYTAPTIAPGLPTSITVTATSQADATKNGQTTLTLNPATVPNAVTVPPTTGYTVTVTAFEASTVVSATPNVTLVVN